MNINKIAELSNKSIDFKTNLMSERISTITNVIWLSILITLRPFEKQLKHLKQDMKNKNPNVV